MDHKFQNMSHKRSLNLKKNWIFIFIIIKKYGNLMFYVLIYKNVIWEVNNEFKVIINKVKIPEYFTLIIF